MHPKTVKIQVNSGEKVISTTKTLSVSFEITMTYSDLEKCKRPPKTNSLLRAVPHQNTMLITNFPGYQCRFPAKTQRHTHRQSWLTVSSLKNGGLTGPIFFNGEPLFENFAFYVTWSAWTNEVCITLDNSLSLISFIPTSSGSLVLWGPPRINNRCLMSIFSVSIIDPQWSTICNCLKIDNCLMSILSMSIVDPPPQSTVDDGLRRQSPYVDHLQVNHWSAPRINSRWLPL